LRCAGVLDVRRAGVDREAHDCFVFEFGVDEVGSAILRLAVIGLVVSNGTRVTEAGGNQALAINAFAYEVPSDCERASAGQFKVFLCITNVIRVAFDAEFGDLGFGIKVRLDHVEDGEADFIDVGFARLEDDGARK
jgi:hypothetical protein